jgi:SusD family.
MTNFKYIYIVFLTLATVGLSACDDDFLDQSPDDKITGENFWKTKQDAEMALTACYPYLDSPSLIFDDCMADNGYSQFSWDGFQEFGNGTQDANSSHSTGTWDNSYGGIRRCNDFLDNIGNVDVEESLKERMKAESRFLRAYLYFKLSNFFGDVPLITEPQTVGEILPRTPKADVVNFIVNELNDCVAILPSSYDSSETGRITKWAALSLKARVQLYNKQYEEAAVAAKDVIDNGGFSLYPNYGDLFGYDAENSSESILAHQYIKDKHSYWQYLLHASPSAGGWSSVSPLIDLVDAYECVDGKTIATSPLYDAENPYENRDPRLAYTVILPGSEFNGQVIDTHPESSSPNATGKNNATRTGFNLRKHILPEDAAKGWDCGADFMLIRLAEVKLIYAEAMIERNLIDATVLQQINDIRERAYNNTSIPYPQVTTMDQSELRKIVRNERRVELAFEGFRYDDIRRWEIAEDVRKGPSYGMRYVKLSGDKDQVLVEGNRFFDPNRDYLWPIPTKELELNEKLTQNPGY